MTSGYEKGLLAETVAAWYLRFKGYSILARRFKTPVGEIDLVAARGRTLIFVEVKHRKSEDAAAFAIHPRSQARISRAAELYLQRHPSYTGYALRFDALVLTPWGWPRHLPNAW